MLRVHLRVRGLISKLRRCRAVALWRGGTEGGVGSWRAVAVRLWGHSGARRSGAVIALRWGRAVRLRRSVSIALRRDGAVAGLWGSSTIVGGRSGSSGLDGGASVGARVVDLARWWVRGIAWLRRDEGHGGVVGVRLGRDGTWC